MRSATPRDASSSSTDVTLCLPEPGAVKGITMNAVHIRTDGMHCDECPPRIKAQIEHLTGVKAACAYRTMHLTSVLFDPELIDVKTISDQIASAGFETHVLTGGRAH